MGWFTSTDDAAKAGKADAKADVKAGGFAKGWSGARRGEMSEAETTAYDKNYKANVPKKWWQ